MYLKPGEGHDYAIVDAAMNDLLRPALYDAWHAVESVRPRDVPTRRWQIVGPVCESADFLARDRLLALADGDLLAVRGAGAYGFAMSSNYNSRPRACEVVVAATGCISSVRARTRRIFSRANPRCPERICAAQRTVLRTTIFRVCVSATIAHATRGIGGEILQFNKMWLEFRQQVAVGLSSGCSSN